MESMSKLAAVVAALLFLLAVVGRFWSTPDISWFGHVFAASTFLILGNTALLVAVYLHLVGSTKS